MGIFDTVSSVFAASGSDTSDDATGAYWCDDCGVRVRDVNVEDERLELADDGTPECPDCGDAMRFERSHADGCAC
jgi:predicted RNA-binding Zn-ribbon protein involved in translation (DUF1610 family)